MIQGWKELCDVKCYNTSMVLLEPSCMDEVSKVDASIGSRLLSNTAKLIWVQKTIVNHMELKSITNDFLNELASSVK